MSRRGEKGKRSAPGFSLKRFLAALLLLVASYAWPQYFGRNKVQYDKFDFHVLKTRHFDIHHYSSDTALMNNVALLSERWYSYFNRLLGDTFYMRNPLVIYTDHPDFQQTNVTTELIDVGTGGFTEGMKQRLVMPLAGSYAATNHVLGHEMAHVFQYDLLRNLDTLDSRMIYNAPLWLVEGMAEYFSIGHDYPLSAMWLRDAVARDDIPSIEKISRDLRYNPYRYGHALWAFMCGRWGDTIVPHLFLATVQTGFEPAVKNVLGLSMDSLNALWIKTLKDAYRPVLESRKQFQNEGQLVLSAKRRSGEMNLAPSLSPDGRFVVFVSERDLFSIDLFLADARTGKVIRKLGGSATSPHYGTLNFVESSGSWSPDGKQFVYPVYNEGDHKLLIIDIKKGRKRQLLGFPGVGSIVNPAWSPDGKFIVFSGSATGMMDLYLYELATKKLARLTNDQYADLHPSWSPDGKKIVFISDRGEEEVQGKIRFGEFRVNVYDIEKKKISILPLFENTRHINPQFSPDGNSIYFISDPDGFSDVYRVEIPSGNIYRITHSSTGVSGLTELSPAFSIAAKKGNMVYSVFQNFQFNVHGMSEGKVKGEPVKGISDTLHAGWLPPFQRKSRIVSDFTALPVSLPGRDTAFTQVKYRSRLVLDYLGNVYIGAGVSQYGAGVTGGALLRFSDMLENHIVFTTIQLNGRLKDVGGQVLYLNRKTRYQWGSYLSHIPYLSSGIFRGVERVGQDLIPFTDYVVQRTFEDRINLLGSYPFSQVTRVEMGGGYRFIYFSRERRRFYDPGFDVEGDGDLVKLDAPPGFHLAEISAAYVGDNSFFGITEPLNGYRYRVEAGQTGGSYTFSNLLADFRYYYRLRPFTLAARGLHYGRYFKDAEADVLAPYFLGFEYFMRGYSIYSFDPSECEREDGTGACPAFDRLVGSKLAVFNAELRLPFTGPRRLAVISSRSFYSSLNLFFDGGVTWTKDELPVWKFLNDSPERIPVFATGLSYRINFYNVMIFEFYLAYPFQRPQKGWHFGFQIMPGW